MSTIAVTVAELPHSSVNAKKWVSGSSYLSAALISFFIAAIDGSCAGSGSRAGRRLFAAAVWGFKSHHHPDKAQSS